MQIEIFDVGHGQCAVITSPNGQRLMIDCGARWDEQTFWTPSLHHLQQTLGLLIVTNLDEDHLNDFDFVIQHCTIPWIISSPTIGAREFALLKKDGMGSGAKAFANWLARPRVANALYPLPPQPDFGPVAVRWYWNPYVPGYLDTTNDLSVVVVVQYGPFKIVFTGDLEAAGWRNLLRNQSFLADIATVAVLVASHHGRESGCCTELFDVVRPEIVIISDDEHKYESQDTADWYRNRCRGIPYTQNPFERRYVMTTRKDGSMRIDVGQDGRWLLTPVQVRQFRRSSAGTTTNLGVSALAGLSSNSLGVALGVQPPLSSLLRLVR